MLRQLVPAAIVLFGTTLAVPSAADARMPSHKPTPLPPKTGGTS
jgi:hypothetical protein